MDTFQTSIEHVRFITIKPFKAVIKTLELQLGIFDYAVQTEISQHRNLPAVKAKIERMEGTSGLMIFSIFDHGAFLEESDKRREAMQYVIGNPLIAMRMTRYDIRAALYAPLRILVYENHENKTCIEYDKPSSLFGQFGNADVLKVALELDQKLENLLTNVMNQ